MSIHSIRFDHHSTVFQNHNIEDRLRRAVAKGDENSVLDLMKESEFSTISSTTIEANLFSASMLDHLGVVLTLMKSMQFNDLSADFLGKILKAVSLKGYQRIVDAFIECRRFGDISVDLLGEIQIETLEKGDLDIVRAFIKSIRSNDISAEHLGKILIGALEKNDLDIAHATIRCKEFGKVLDCHEHILFGQNSLRDFLKKIVEKGGRNIVLAIIEHREFDREDPPKNFMHSLGQLLSLAVLDNNLAIIHAVMGHKRFNNINPSYLGATLGLAAYMGRLDMIRTFMKNTRFLDLDQYLGLALKQASLFEKENIHVSNSNRLEIIKILMEHAKFDEGSIGYLGEALETACTHNTKDSISDRNRLEVVKVLASDKRFDEIKEFQVGRALSAASNGGYLDIIFILESYAKFNKIEKWWFECALERASNEGHLEVVERITSYNVMDHIRAESLTKALEGASERGHIGIIYFFINYKRFRDFNVNKALLYAVHQGHLQVATAIMNSEKFAEISADYLNKTLNIILEKGYAELVYPIMKSNKIDARTLGKVLKNTLGHCLEMEPFLQSEYIEHILQNFPNEKLHLDNARIIARHTRFNEISAEDLGEVLEIASAKGYPDIVDVIIDHKNYDKIHIKHLQESLKKLRKITTYKL